MKSSVAIVVTAAAIGLALVSHAPHAKGPESTKTAAGVTYKPPLRGAPVTRIGAGSRGVGVALRVNVLAPRETGYTTQEQPTVYWFVSQGVDRPVELMITREESPRAAAKPALEVRLQPPIEKGIHALRLADHGITLEQGVEYRWFVAVVRDPAQRSKDVIAGGTIKRVAESDALRAQRTQVAQARWSAVYAEAGIWYDAIDQLSKQISMDRGNQALRGQRAALLEQVGLRDAAAFDRGSGG